MSLSQSQNDAITQILKDYFNQFLLNVASNAFIIKCKQLKGKEQIETFQGEMITILNQATKERFAQTKSGIFSFISQQQTVKLTEVAFKNIFDKYFIPVSMQSQYRNKPNDMVLQMGLILITGNIKQIFQTNAVPILFIKQAKKDNIDSDFFIKYIGPVIDQVPAVIHSQLLGTEPPVLHKLDAQSQLKSKMTCKCKQYKESIKIQQQLIKLLENKNKILQQQLNNTESSDLSSKLQSQMQSRQLYNTNKITNQSDKHTRQPHLGGKVVEQSHSQSNIQLREITNNPQKADRLSRQIDINEQPYSQQSTLQQNNNLSISNVKKSDNSLRSKDQHLTVNNVRQDPLNDNDTYFKQYENADNQLFMQGLPLQTKEIDRQFEEKKTAAKSQYIKEESEESESATESDNSSNNSNSNMEDSEQTDEECEMSVGSSNGEQLDLLNINQGAF